MDTNKERTMTEGSEGRYRFWKRKIALPVGIVILLAVAGSSVGFVMGSLDRNDDQLFLAVKKWIGVFGQVYRDVAINYVEEVDPEKFMRAGIDGMLKTLDPYTAYLGERENDELDLVTTGKYAGVGITIGLRDGYITVISPMEGYSAAKRGVQSGDRILEIDGKRLQSATPQDVRMMVRGAPGTTLRMMIEREGEPKPLEFVLVREEIPVRNVSFAGFVGDGVGYIRLERFSRTAGNDVRSSINELRGKGSIRAIILDLRDNPGGLLDVAVEVASKFLPESTLVVSTKGRRSDSERKYRTTESPMLADVPMAVLIDRGSASASEIVAGAIQDLDRGILVGTRSFGKGLVQTITRIDENSSLKITTGKYYTPSGRSIQEIDYAHRTKDGVFTLLPDSLKVDYRTVHQRVVRDGGGIVPDSAVADPQSIKFLDELNRKAMFFKYANMLATEKKSLSGDFEVTDDVLRNFEAFLKEKEFRYEEEAEAALKELRETGEDARYGKSFSESIDQIATIVEKEKARVFERYKQEIRQALRLEIISRMKGEKAAIEASLKDDGQVQVAAALLKNKSAYQKLLVPAKK